MPKNLQYSIIDPILRLLLKLGSIRYIIQIEGTVIKALIALYAGSGKIPY